MKKFSISFLLLVTLGGCVVAPQGQVSLPQDNEDLSRGRRYFLRECGRCHGLVYPEERSSEVWQKILSRKSAKISLTGEQFILLQKFMVTGARPYQGSKK